MSAGSNGSFKVDLSRASFDQLARVSWQELCDHYHHLCQTSGGRDHTITLLQRDIHRLEHDLYAGGYQPERLVLLEKMRQLSRDLYRLYVTHPVR